MSTGHFLLVLTFATAALAVWSYVRWPRAAPTTVRGAVVRVLISLVLLQVGAAALNVGVAATPTLAIVMLVGAVVPVLTFAFLASLWFLKACADQIHGAR